MAQVFVATMSGADFDVLQLLDKIVGEIVVVAGNGTARSIFGIYRSIRAARHHADAGTEVAPLIYKLGRDLIWYLLSEL